LPGESQPEASLLDWLKTTFDVVQIDDVTGLEELAADDSAALVVCTPRLLQGLQAAMPAESAVKVLQHIGEGVGMVDTDGSVTWANARLEAYDDETRRHFAELCGKAVDLLNAPEALDVPVNERTSSKLAFHSGDHHFELVVSPASTAPDDERRVTAVVGVLWDVTAGRRLLDKLDAIDAAGSELMKIEAESIATLSMTDRLKLLEEKPPGAGDGRRHHPGADRRGPLPRAAGQRHHRVRRGVGRELSVPPRQGGSAVPGGSRRRRQLADRAPAFARPHHRSLQRRVQDPRRLRRE
jgi:hypothetical protein